MKKLLVCVLVGISLTSFSQEMLPKFYTKILSKNKVQISWFNPYESQCVQVSVQRSYDSLKFYNTIFTSLSPQLPQNGFVDNDYLPELKNYYRIFYVLADGKFFFSTPINPANFTNSYTSSTTNIANTTNITDNNDYNTADSINVKLFDNPTITTTGEIKKMYSIYKRKTTHLAYVLNEQAYKKFADSIGMNTKDTLLELENEIVMWNPYAPPPAWKPSIYVFSNAKGNVEMYFDNYKTSKYKIIFTDALGNKVFSIKHVNEPKLILEKANFIKAGWYYFELFENEKLIEKNKFFIESDF